MNIVACGIITGSAREMRINLNRINRWEILRSTTLTPEQRSQIEEAARIDSKHLREIIGSADA